MAATRNLFTETNLGFSKITDVGSTVLSARGVRIKVKAVDLQASMDLPPRLLGSYGTLEGTLL